MPSSARTIDMLVSREPDILSTWTRQPGGSGHIMHTVAVGAVSTADALIPFVERAMAARAVESPSARVLDPLGGVVKLRDYQEDAVKAVLDAWETGAKAPLIVLPCASGKTIISAALMATAKSRAQKCLFIAQRQELLTQTIDKVRLVSPTTRVGLVQAASNELGREITVCSIQTLGHKNGTRLREVIEAGPYSIVVVDEAHHAVSPAHMRVITALREANPGLLMMGMTATPGREDGVALDRVFDAIVYERNLMDMIRLGWLVPPRIFSQKIDVDLSGVDVEGRDYVTTQLARVMNTPHVNRMVVEAWRKYGFDRKCLVYTCDVKHAKDLAQEFNDSGSAAGFVHGGLKKKERDQVLSDFREGRIKLLCNCQVLVEGYDDPSAEGIVWARPTQSQTLALQATGRALRLYPGKTEAIIIDCVGNSEKHRPVQLATLTGFDPERRFASNGKGFGEEDDIPPETEEEKQEITDARLGAARELTFTARAERSAYQWRQTSVGWILQVPRIGYYLVAWSDKNHHMATIRFFDQRPGRKDDPPREVVFQPVDFEMAYGLVEGELDRIFRARSNRKNDLAPDDDQPAVASFVDIDEGVDEAIFIDEEMMLKEAGWREKAMTAKQRALLVKHGVKEKTMPETAGEASDLITIIRVEHDLKMRLPATSKQLAYLRVNELGVTAGMTKGKAASIIWRHRRDTGK